MLNRMVDLAIRIMLRLIRWETGQKVSLMEGPVYIRFRVI